MRVKALNAIKFSGELLKTGSVFEVDMKTGEKLFARGHAVPTNDAVVKTLPKVTSTAALVKRFGTPVMGQPKKK